VSASDDFPRGAYLDSGLIGGGGGQAASVTFPASAGIAWSLTSVNAVVIVVATGGSGDFIAEITALCQGVITILGLLVLSTVAVGESATASWTGQITFPAGAAVIVAASATNGFSDQDLTATANPV
jgi:hypothetical protein